MKDTEVQLKQSKLSFKLNVTKPLEDKIRILCSNIPTVEWSGILFYRPKGDLDEGTFEVDCVDLLLMDIGSSTYTEFETSPDLAEYVANNLDLFDCQIGLIHSHNTMATFFSGTDNNTLLSQGQESNHFLSLIVNNAGEYTAAITRQVSSDYTVNEVKQYKSFGDKVIKKKSKAKGTKLFIEKINAEIAVDRDHNLIDRITEIKKSKVKAVPQQGNLFESLYDAPKDKKKPEGWLNNYYQSYGKKSETLKNYENTIEYQILCEIFEVADLSQVDSNYEETCCEPDISNQEFKAAVIEMLNFYDEAYVINRETMLNIVDLLPENRFVSTFKSVLL